MNLSICRRRFGMEPLSASQSGISFSHSVAVSSATWVKSRPLFPKCQYREPAGRPERFAIAEIVVPANPRSASSSKVALQIRARDRSPSSSLAFLLVITRSGGSFLVALGPLQDFVGAQRRGDLGQDLEAGRVRQHALGAQLAVGVAQTHVGAEQGRGVDDEAEAVVARARERHQVAVVK